MKQEIQKPYQLLANCYDSVYGNDKYKDAIIQYVRKLREKYSIKTDIILDLACGSGFFLEQMLLCDLIKKAYGVDLSPGMVESAKSKLRHYNNIQITLGSFIDFSLPQKMDSVFCMGDSINYIDSIEQLSLVFKQVSKCLKNEGFFIFDVIPEYLCRLSDGYESEVKAGGVCYKTSSRYNPETKVKSSIMTFADGKEEHRQIPIEIQDIEQTAKETDFELLGAFSSMNFRELEQDSLRIYCILRKIK